jgi:hypothetical protein
MMLAAGSEISYHDVRFDYFSLTTERPDPSGGNDHGLVLNVGWSSLKFCVFVKAGYE